MTAATAVFVGIGSNVDRERHIAGAVAALRARFGPLGLSPVYASAPIGMAGEDFYNLVAGFDTSQPVPAVAQGLREIEAAHGRRRGEHRYASRTLDLDLLAYGDFVGEVDGLCLPRADILDYAFVLGPLAALAPEARHPVLARPYGALWAERPPAERALLRPVPPFLKAGERAPAARCES